MKSGIFAREGRMSDEEDGCRMRNPTKKTGLAERCGAMSNFRGEAPGDRGEAPGDCGEAPGDHGEATNFHGEATHFNTHFGDASPKSGKKLLQFFFAA